MKNWEENKKSVSSHIFFFSALVKNFQLPPDEQNEASAIPVNVAGPIFFYQITVISLWSAVSLATSARIYNCDPSGPLVFCFLLLIIFFQICFLSTKPQNLIV